MNTFPTTIDIIIPVYNRGSALRQTLQALALQLIPLDCSPRIIICDDGSDESIKNVCNEYAARLSPVWRGMLYVHQEHQGISQARNLGLKESNADIIFFLGSDILLQPPCLAAHWDFHVKNADSKKGAVGFVSWDPRLNVSPFMEWMVHGGPQNNFDELLGQVEADPRHFFYASHISLKRSILSNLYFNPVYKQYGWEDLDMGNHLFKRGLSLHVLHNEVGLHHHMYTVNDIRRRQLQVGTSFVLYQKNNPELEVSLSNTPFRFFKHMVFRFTGVIFFATLLVKGGKTSFPRLFSLLTTHWFLRAFWVARGKIKP